MDIMILTTKIFLGVATYLGLYVGLTNLNHRFNKDTNHKKFQKFHTMITNIFVKPVVLSLYPICRPKLEFLNCTKEEFADDLANNKVLLMGNHRHFRDALMIIQLVNWFGSVSRFRCFYGSHLKTYPIISNFLSNSICLERNNHDKDTDEIKKQMDIINELGSPSSLLIFPGGGLIRNPKLAPKTKAIYPHLTHVNMPKVNGFAMSVRLLRPDTVYCFVFHYPYNFPSMLSWLETAIFGVSIKVIKYPVGINTTDINPDWTNDQFKEFLNATFYNINFMLAKFYKENPQRHLITLDTVIAKTMNHKKID
jgi:hypothetical protein